MGFAKMRRLAAMAATLLAVFASGAPEQAQAQTADQLLKTRYLHFTGEAVSDDLRVARFVVPGRPYYQEILVGAGAKHLPHAVLLHCNARTCMGKTVRFGGYGASFDSLQLVDLAGAALSRLDDKTYSIFTLDNVLMVANEPSRQRPNATVQRKPARPQLAVILTASWNEGVGAEGRVRSELTMIDVATAKGAALFSDATVNRAYSGAGLKQTFALVRSPEHATLDLEARGERLVDNSSGCLPAQPKPYTLTLVGNRFELCSVREWTQGCGGHEDLP